MVANGPEPGPQDPQYFGLVGYVRVSPSQLVLALHPSPPGHVSISVKSAKLGLPSPAYNLDDGKDSNERLQVRGDHIPVRVTPNRAPDLLYNVSSV